MSIISTFLLSQCIKKTKIRKLGNSDSEKDCPQVHPNTSFPSLCMNYARRNVTFMKSVALEEYSRTHETEFQVAYRSLELLEKKVLFNTLDKACII